MPAASLADLEPGRLTSVAAPATSANIGPGFDCFGLALDWRDRVDLEVIDHGYAVEVSGEGAAEMPLDDSHLILAAATAGLADLGWRAPGLRLRAHNTVPHGRGLGSSAAAIVAGLLAARGLARAGPDPGWVLRRAASIEGHPDNVAAAIFGGFTLAFERGAEIEVAEIPLHPELSGWLFVAEDVLATSTARRLLPASVPHVDAVANSARAALLVHAVSTDPDLLAEATRDWLHTSYRSSGMPASSALLTRLRGRGLAAVISGAGPSVLVLGRAGELEELETLVTPGFRGRPITVGAGGCVASGDAENPS